MENVDTKTRAVFAGCVPADPFVLIFSAYGVEQNAAFSGFMDYGALSGRSPPA